MEENKVQTYIRDSQIEGKGIFTSENISEGSYILKIDDSRLITDEKPLKPERGEFEYHCDHLPDGRIILWKSPERYINHSCDPNTFVKSVEDIRYVVALRDITKDDEITFDYRIDSLGDEEWDCSCGSMSCTKRVHSNFFHMPLEKQLKYLPLISKEFRKFNEKEINNLLTGIE